MNGWTVLAAGAAAGAVWLLHQGRSLPQLRGPTALPRLPAWVLAAIRGQLTTRAVQQRERQIRDGVAAACDLLAVCVEAGRPPRAALRLVAEASPDPTRSALMGACHQLDIGIDELRVWAALGEQPGYRGVARDLARSVRTGVALASLLREHARLARADAETASRTRARRASVSAVVPLMVCFLPAFLLVGVVPIFGGLVDQVVSFVGR